VSMLESTLMLADSGWHHMDMDSGWWVTMVIGMALFWGLVILGGIWLVRELVHRRSHEPEPLELLDRRLAEGTISTDEYRERRAILSDSSSPQGKGSD